MTTIETKKAIDELNAWYEGWRPKSGRDPERFVVCAGLAVLEHMRETFPLSREDFVTPLNQVKTGGPFIRRILLRHGEQRVYASEGGRTTRGTVTAAESLVERINGISEIATMTGDERAKLIYELQGWLADHAKEYFNQQRIAVDIDLAKPTSQIIGDILDLAQGKAGAVAQHLVGAKLAIRFENSGYEIENHSYTTADRQLGRPGDFSLGDAVFHVTMAPMPGVIDKCRENVRNGRFPILLVPDAMMAAARGMAKVAEMENNIEIASSIESFVGQNISEMGRYEKDERLVRLSQLLDEYNRRVEQVETDRSLLMEIPEHLQHVT